MSDARPQVVAEITHDAHARCQAIGGGALEAVELLRADLEKNPELGRRAGSAASGIKIYTTRLEGTEARPPLTITYVYDAPPPEPGLIRIALVSPVRLAGGDAGV